MLARASRRADRRLPCASVHLLKNHRPRHTKRKSPVCFWEEALVGLGICSWLRHLVVDRGVETKLPRRSASRTRRDTIRRR